MALVNKSYSALVDHIGNAYELAIALHDEDYVLVVGMIHLTSQMLRDLADDVDEVAAP